MDKFKLSLGIFVFFVLITSVTAADLSGYVRDEEGVLPFASVRIIETGQGTIADEDGYFEITGLNSDQTYTLEISYIGYENAQFTSGGGSINSFILRQDILVFEDTEVTFTKPLWAISKANIVNDIQKYYGNCDIECDEEVIPLYPGDYIDFNAEDSYDTEDTEGSLSSSQFTWYFLDRGYTFFLNDDIINGNAPESELRRLLENLDDSRVVRNQKTVRRQFNFEGGEYQVTILEIKKSNNYDYFIQYINIDDSNFELCDDSCDGSIVGSYSSSREDDGSIVTPGLSLGDQQIQELSVKACESDSDCGDWTCNQLEKVCSPSSLSDLPCVSNFRSDKLHYEGEEYTNPFYQDSRFVGGTGCSNELPLENFDKSLNEEEKLFREAENALLTAELIDPNAPTLDLSENQAKIIAESFVEIISRQYAILPEPIRDFLPIVIMESGMIVNSLTSFEDEVEVELQKILDEIPTYSALTYEDMEIYKWITYLYQYGGDVYGLFSELDDLKSQRVNGIMTDEEIAYKERIATNILPISYDLIIDDSSRIEENAGSAQKLKDFVANENKYTRDYWDESNFLYRVRIDTFRLYLGLGQYYGFLEESDYGLNPKYVRYTDDGWNGKIYSYPKMGVVHMIKSACCRSISEVKENLEELKDWGGDESTILGPIPNSQFTKNLGNFENHLRYDEERGEEYLEYFDYWDLDPAYLADFGIDVDQYNFPIAIYGRIYENDFEEYNSDSEIGNKWFDIMVNGYTGSIKDLFDDESTQLNEEDVSLGEEVEFKQTELNDFETTTLEISEDYYLNFVMGCGEEDLGFRFEKDEEIPLESSEILITASAIRKFTGFFSKITGKQTADSTNRKFVGTVENIFNSLANHEDPYLKVSGKNTKFLNKKIGGALLKSFNYINKRDLYNTISRANGNIAKKENSLLDIKKMGTVFIATLPKKIYENKNLEIENLDKLWSSIRFIWVETKEDKYLEIDGITYSIAAGFYLVPYPMENVEFKEKRSSLKNYINSASVGFYEINGENKPFFILDPLRGGQLMDRFSEGTKFEILKLSEGKEYFIVSLEEDYGDLKGGIIYGAPKIDKEGKDESLVKDVSNDEATESTSRKLKLGKRGGKLDLDQGAIDSFTDSISSGGFSILRKLKKIDFSRKEGLVGG